MSTMPFLALSALAEAAISIDEDDWGSPRQVEAQNKFFAEVEKIVSKEDFELLEQFCLKATDAEMVCAAINLLLKEPYWSKVVNAV